MVSYDGSIGRAKIITYSNDDIGKEPYRERNAHPKKMISLPKIEPIHNPMFIKGA